MKNKNGVRVLTLALLVVGFLLIGAARHPGPLTQSTATPNADEILLTPPLARTPLPTEIPGGPRNGWIAVSMIFFVCMVSMLAGGILIAMIMVRLRERRR